MREAAVRLFCVYRGVRAIGAHLMRLRRKLVDDASNPTYIFVEPRAGYGMARGEEPEQVAE